jgi:formylglycine-generating enzyme required for sulfatase activity
VSAGTLIATIGAAFFTSGCAYLVGLTKRTDDVDAGIADASSDERVADLDAPDVPDVQRDVVIPEARRSCVDARIKCGARFDIDCCASTRFDGGTFPMGRSVDGIDRYPDDLVLPSDQPEHRATVAPFELDVFEVTVGRFWAFVADKYVPLPRRGEGAIPDVPGSGWREEWNAQLALQSGELITSLHECGSLGTFPEGRSENAVPDTLPINCVTWYEALAFCIWDGGRLPSEAEWEFAAANGAANRLFPWGPTPDYFCTHAKIGNCTEEQGPRSVGLYEPGRAASGQFDMMGNVGEYVFDMFASYTAEACSNCVIVPPQGGNWSAVVRGGNFTSDPGEGRAAARDRVGQEKRGVDRGFRCAYPVLP